MKRICNKRASAVFKSLRFRLTFIMTILLFLSCFVLMMVYNHTSLLMSEKIALALKISSTLSAPVEAENAESVSPEVQSPVLPAIPTKQSYAISAQKAFKLDGIFFLMLIVLLGGVITYIVTGSFVRPIDELNSQMKNMSVYKLAEKPELTRAGAEITELSESFYQLTAKLSNTLQAQSGFSAGAAHELRTPLSVLQAKVDIFQKEKKHTNQEYDTFVNDVGVQTERLSGIVKTLLEMANMEEIMLDEKIAVFPLIDEVVMDLGDVADRFKIEVTLSGEDGIVSGNYGLLYRAFYNIIENAVKYNHENGTVRISLTNKEEKLFVCIQDTGIGIPEELRERIFEPFFRVDSSRARKSGGCGLGLSFVKNIIEKHGGSISVIENPKGGTCFKVEFYLQNC